MRHRVSFELDDFEGYSQQLVPLVDGRRLVDLVEELNANIVGRIDVVEEFRPTA